MASTIKVDKIEGSTGSTITVPTGQTLTVTDGIPVASGGTGLASFTAGDILYATGATTLVKLAKGTGRQGLQTNSGATAPEWADSPQSLMTAAGDTLYASGANTLAKLAKGSDDDVLTLASGVPSWAASAGGGKIGQVLSATFTGTQVIDAATTWTDITSLTQAITPAAATSKILVMYSINVGSTSDAGTRIIRGTTAIFVGDTEGSREPVTVDGSNRETSETQLHAMMFLDSPSTTSATTYKIQGVGSSTKINRSVSDSDGYTYFRSASSITLMEVLA